ncbi:MAG TPA: Nramp family divalent metal transporter [Bryobacteraceae bacterium]|nr:Nramp family divalent metal transporter [Bryobacteraceae bacterium]
MDGVSNLKILADNSVGPTSSESPPKGWTVRRPWVARVLMFLVVFGPGLIVMEADNDAGAVQTYMQAGAQYGFHLLWLMLLLLPVCYFVQEMVARLGIATGQGHAAMIFQRFGKWWGVFSLGDLLLVNFLTLITEFIAVSLATRHICNNAPWVPYVTVPIFAVLLIIHVMSGSYRRWERITVFLCIMDCIWFVMAYLTHPAGGEIIRNTILPHIPPAGVLPSGLPSSPLVFLVIGIVGTTIAPWQLFFQQSCVADKKLRFKDLNMARLDTFIGACFTVLVAGAMIVVGALAVRHNLQYDNFDPAQYADDIRQFFNSGFIRTGILIMFCNAAVLGTTAISLSSAWAWAEVKGWPHSLELPASKAKGFYTVYALCTMAAAGVTLLIPEDKQGLVVLGVQVLAGVILPSAIIFLQLLLNDHELLGDQWVNKKWNNWINWIIIIVLFILSLILAMQVLVPKLFPQS